MPIPVNTKRVHARLLIPDNIIMYLDQLWKITEIDLSDTTQVYIIAIRQTNHSVNDPCHHEINQDILHLNRQPNNEFVVIEDEKLIEQMTN